MHLLRASTASVDPTQTNRSAIARERQYDCTFKESLYSTHPYLTYSNKKSTLPVMTKFSIRGYREKIGNYCLIAWCCGEEQRWTYIPVRCPRMQFEQVPPPPTQHFVVIWINNPTSPFLHLQGIDPKLLESRDQWRTRRNITVDRIHCIDRWL